MNTVMKYKGNNEVQMQVSCHHHLQKNSLITEFIEDAKNANTIYDCLRYQTNICHVQKKVD